MKKLQLIYPHRLPTNTQKKCAVNSELRPIKKTKSFNSKDGGKRAINFPCPLCIILNGSVTAKSPRASNTKDTHLDPLLWFNKCFIGSSLLSYLIKVKFQY